MFINLYSLLQHKLWPLQASFEAPWCDLLRATKMLDAEELFVACRTFKAELKDVADEEIRRRSREIILQHHYDQVQIDDDL